MGGDRPQLHLDLLAAKGRQLQCGRGHRHPPHFKLPPIHQRALCAAIGHRDRQSGGRWGVANVKSGRVHCDGPFLEIGSKAGKHVGGGGGRSGLRPHPSHYVEHQGSLGRNSDICADTVSSTPTHTVPHQAKDPAHKHAIPRRAKAHAQKHVTIRLDHALGGLHLEHVALRMVNLEMGGDGRVIAQLNFALATPPELQPIG